MSNCIIAQSGGPTSVINSSVVGLFYANKELKAFDNVFAGLNGIQGILNEDIINLSEQSDEDIEIFRNTPSSGLGSCRYKMKNLEESTEEYEKLLDILKANDIKAFFYVGGNDSMDTTAKLSKFAKEKNLDIQFIGIPKTIDNDLVHTDHTPGFGSAAKFICTSILETYLDASVYINNGIFIIETMGRDTGWLAASSMLARIDGKPVVDFIYLPEAPFCLEKFLADVRKRFEEKNKVYIVASEGIRDSNGKFLSEMTMDSAQDNFGHAQLGGVGSFLRSKIIESGITSRVKALELSVLQRCAMHCASQIDLDEAFNAGATALKYAKEGKNGYMVGIKRKNSSIYSTEHFLIEANEVANNVKYFPTEWINEDGNNIKEDALSYFQPLVGDLPKYKVFHKR